MKDVSDIIQGSNRKDGVATIKKAMVPVINFKRPVEFETTSAGAEAWAGRGAKGTAREDQATNPLGKPLCLPPIVNCVQFLAKDIDQPPLLVQGILHQGSKMVLAGGSKSFKTWVLLDLALSVAEGIPWWGFPTTTAKVLYINFELQDFSIHERLKLIMGGKDKIDRPPNLDLWNLRGHCTAFEYLIPEVINRIREHGYGLIIIDPIYKGLGDSDENSASGIGRLMNEIERLAVETGAAVVFGAHFSKGNQSRKESIDRMSGSGVFARDPDTILTMTAHGKEETYSVDVTLRNFAPLKPFCVEWVFPLMVKNDRLDPENLKDPAVKKVIHTPEKVLALLPEEGLTLADWKKAAIGTEEEKIMSDRTFSQKKKELVDQKRVTEVDGIWKQVKPQE
ncbi:MAG: AAA family ATPase [Terrimicrobiaceae bacterium]